LSKTQKDPFFALASDLQLEHRQKFPVYSYHPRSKKQLRIGLLQRERTQTKKASSSIYREPIKDEKVRNFKLLIKKNLMLHDIEVAASCLEPIIDEEAMQEMYIAEIDNFSTSLPIFEAPLYTFCQQFDCKDNCIVISLYECGEGEGGEGEESF
jgi:hypothetical protein